MFGKLFSLVSGLALALLLAVGGLAGYLWGTGELDAERVELIAAVLRGEFDPSDGGEAEAVEITEEDEDAGETVRATTEEESDRLREQAYLDSLELERAARDLEAQRRLVDQALQNVVKEQERLKWQESQFEEHREKVVEEAVDQGFEKLLEYINGLKPRHAKEYVISVWRDKPEDVVRLFLEIDVRKGKRILEQFDTENDAERKIYTDLLEQISSKGMQGYAE